MYIVARIYVKEFLLRSSFKLDDCYVNGVICPDMSMFVLY
jgi:hypothetical protein